VSHPAIVAYENDNGSFDLHYSRNGAEQYQLKHILDGYLEGEYQKMGTDMPALLPTEVAEFAADQDGIKIAEHSLIEEKPFAEAIEPSKVPFRIPDMSAEALFVVRDWKVDVFSIVPITPSLLPLLATAVEVRLYDCEELGILPQEATSGEQPASYSLSGLDFFDLSIYKEMADVLYYPFSQYHLDLLKRINREVQIEDGGGSDSVSTVLYHDGCVIEYNRTQSEEMIPWSVLFVEVWSGDDDQPVYPWEYNQDNLSPRWLTNELRLELSMIFIEELQQNIGTLRVDGQARLLNIREYRRRELTRFFTEIKNRYGGAIAEEFSDLTLFTHSNTKYTDF